MKNKTIACLLIILFALAMNGSLISQNHDLCSISNEKFTGKEKLTYRMYYNWAFVWIPAGEVTFEVKECDDYYEVFVEGKTYPSYNSFFEVEDYFYSRFDRETLLPSRFVRRINEGSYFKYDSINFDQEARTAKGMIGISRDLAQSYSVSVDGCVHDILSVLYHTRNISFDELEQGHKIPFDVFFDKEHYALDLEYGGVDDQKDIKDLGKFSTIKLVPEMVAGEVFDENSRMKIWVSHDENRIPLLIESPVSVGSVKAVLLDYDGLKYPFGIAASK